MTRPTVPDTPSHLRLRDYLPYRLAATSNLVTIWEWRVIAILGEGVPMTAQAISDSAAMDKVSVSRAVRSLEDRGLVERENHAADRRSRMLHLTADGRRVYDEIAPVALAQEAALLAEFSSAEIKMLAGLLDRLRQRSEELSGV